MYFESRSDSANRYEPLSNVPVSYIPPITKGDSNDDTRSLNDVQRTRNIKALDKWGADIPIPTKEQPQYHIAHQESRASILPLPQIKPSPQKHEEPVYVYGPIKPRIAIIIDDMGMSRKYTRAMMDLPGPLTLAFLPYAPKVKGDAQYALSQGHELMIHTPMEPLDPDLYIGPIGLTSEMSIDEIKGEIVDKVLASFDGYKGVNNHMGSRLTQDAEAMQAVMTSLQGRGLYFVDSVTIPESVAADEAKKAGLDYAKRDVFLDHFPDEENVRKYLKKLEKLSYKKDGVIGIGHPKDYTYNALSAWLPTLKEKGIELVPASEVVTQNSQAHLELR